MGWGAWLIYLRVTYGSTTTTTTNSAYTFQINVAQGVGQTCMTDNTQNTNYCTGNIQNVPVNIGDTVTFNFIPASGYQFDHYYVNGGSGVSGTQNPVTETIVGQGNCGGTGQPLCSLGAFFITLVTTSTNPTTTQVTSTTVSTVSSVSTSTSVSVTVTTSTQALSTVTSTNGSTAVTFVSTVPATTVTFTVTSTTNQSWAPFGLNLTQIASTFLGFVFMLSSIIMFVRR